MEHKPKGHISHSSIILVTLRQLLVLVIKILQMSLKAKKERELALESTKEKEHADWQENNNSVCVKQILFDLKDSFYSEKNVFFILLSTYCF